MVKASTELPRKYLSNIQILRKTSQYLVKISPKVRMSGRKNLPFMLREEKRMRNSQYLERFGLLFVAMSFLHMFAAPASASTIAGCPMLPDDNIWNTPIDQLPVDSRSQDYINTIGPDTSFHPDFGEPYWTGSRWSPIGIPYNIVTSSQVKKQIYFDYASESDPGPYPVPDNPLIEGVLPDGDPNIDGDRHILIVDSDNCILYEMFYSWPRNDGGWDAGSGAVFDLRSNNLRPDGWTSADAAGLPILPGLVRYEEVAAGEISHAIRFTARNNHIRKAYVWPARHQANSSTSLLLPPMGQRFRLKADFDISGFSETTQVILRAMKKYGIILADNGSDWYVSGVPDDRWDNDVLVSEFRQLHGHDFEAVDVSSLMVSPDSGEVRDGAVPGPTGASPTWNFLLLLD
jgi:hypothetical protein